MAVNFFQNSHRRLNLHNLRSQSLELVTTVIVINVVIGGFSGELGRKMIGSCNFLITGVRLQPTVQLQLCRSITAKYRSLCTDQI